MAYITTCNVCGKLYEEQSEEYATAPWRYCGPCWQRRLQQIDRSANDGIEPYRYASMKAPVGNGL